MDDISGLTGRVLYNEWRTQRTYATEGNWLDRLSVGQLRSLCYMARVTVSNGVKYDTRNELIAKLLAAK